MNWVPILRDLGNIGCLPFTTNSGWDVTMVINDYLLLPTRKFPGQTEILKR